MYLPSFAKIGPILLVDSYYRPLHGFLRDLVLILKHHGGGDGYEKRNIEVDNVSGSISEKAVKLLNGPKKRKHEKRRCEGRFIACTQEDLEINDVVQMLSD